MIAFFFCQGDLGDPHPKTVFSQRKKDEDTGRVSAFALKRLEVSVIHGKSCYVRSQNEAPKNRRQLVLVLKIRAMTHVDTCWPIADSQRNPMDFVMFYCCLSTNTLQGNAYSSGYRLTCVPFSPWRCCWLQYINPRGGCSNLITGRLQPHTSLVLLYSNECVHGWIHVVVVPWLKMSSWLPN